MGLTIVAEDGRGLGRRRARPWVRAMISRFAAGARAFSPSWRPRRLRRPRSSGSSRRERRWCWSAAKPRCWPPSRCATSPGREAREALAALRRLGIGNLVMLTGDNRRTAEALARELGIDEVRAELLPEQKVEEIERLRARLGTIAWSATASTTPRPWRVRTLASRSVPEPRTPPSRRPTSP